jgi:hypothetical protein
VWHISPGTPCIHPPCMKVLSWVWFPLTNVCWFRYMFTGIFLTCICLTALLFRMTLLTARTPYRDRDVRPCSPHIHRTKFVTSHNEQKTKAIKCCAFNYSIVVNAAHRVTSMVDTDIDAVRKQRRQNTVNNTDWNVSCYCNSRLPKTYTWSGTFILKDGRYT